MQCDFALEIQTEPMEQKILTIDYTEYSSIDELSADDRELVLAAREATSGSYSPFSRFMVGAAVRLADDIVVKGANQENAAFPSGLCAERVAMFYANAAYPDVPVEALAIAASQHGEFCRMPASPCGACRQVMAQVQKRSGKKMRIILAGSEKIYIFPSVDSILPLIFDNLD